MPVRLRGDERSRSSFPRCLRPCQSGCAGWAGREAPSRVRTQKTALRAWVLIPPPSAKAIHASLGTWNFKVGASPSGRGGGIRTHGLFVPNEARYQTAPHPDIPGKFEPRRGTTGAVISPNSGRRASEFSGPTATEIIRLRRPGLSAAEANRRPHGGRRRRARRGRDRGRDRRPPRRGDRPGDATRSEPRLLPSR